MKLHYSWKDFNSAQKKGIISLAAVQILLLATALIDIAMRPAHEIKGKKLWWVMVSFIDFLGPMAYFIYGRKNPDDRKDFI